MGIRMAVALGAVFCLTQLVGCSTESVPVECRVRNSRVGMGKVVMVKNQSEKVLSLSISASGESTSFTLNPGEEKEFGWLEDFQFGDNSSFWITGEGFMPKHFELDNKVTESGT